MPAKLTKLALDVGLVTANAPLALQFYRDLLGFTEDGEVQFPGLGTVKRFRCGESIFRILVLDQPPAATASTGGFASQTGLRYITLTVSNLEEIVDAVSAAGFPVPVPPRPLRPGVRVAQIEDGQGTAVELMQIDA
jgi:catechol 2,3-dioxygenase-like lactoylglutathione lyase family enzyme